MPTINKVILCGTMGQYGATLRYADSGAACASFQLVLTEMGADGRVHATYIPCECWGKRAEAASEVVAGELAIFEGRLAKRKKGEQWEMIVSGFDLQRITPQHKGESREPVHAV